MSSLRQIKLSFLTLLFVCLCAPATTCEAQASVKNNPSYAPPRPMTHSELTRLANTPLTGPRAAMALGPLAVLSAPFVGLAVWTSGSGSPGSGPDGIAAVSLAAMVVVGVALLAYGIGRSKHIRSARNQLTQLAHVNGRSAPSGARAEIGRREATLALRFAY